MKPKPKRTPTPAQLAKLEERMLQEKRLEDYLARQPSRLRQLVCLLAEGPHGWRKRLRV